MIVEKTSYAIECDKCGDTYEEYFTDSVSAKMFSADNGWTEKDGKDYCETCSEKEEDEDE